MRILAALALGLCGVLLLLTWNYSGYTYLIWQHAPGVLGNAVVPFRLASIETLDFVLKIAGLALLAGAALAWPKKVS